MKNLLFLSSFIVLTTSCSLSKVTSNQLAKAQLEFAKANQIIGPDGGSKIDSNLDPILAAELNAEGYISMLAWKMGSDAAQYYNAEGSWDTLDSKYLTWVTQKSQFAAVAKDLKLHRLKKERLALRMEQLLGLAPNVAKDTGRVFIEMWVKPADLFRPCRDPEVTDTGCSTSFPGGAYSSTGSAYDDVYEGLVQNNVRTDPSNGEPPYWAPWTRLGYTYDYHPRNRTHFGMSEYIIRQGAIVKIIKKTPTEEWMGE